MKKMASLAAFLSVAALFFVLYKLFIDQANGLSIIWVIMLSVFIVAWLITKFIITPQIQTAKAAELGIDLSVTPPGKELRKAAKILARRTYFGELSSYFIYFFLIFLFRSFIYEPFKIPSGSMQPTLQIGDYIAVNKHYYRLHDPIWQKTLVKLNPVERGDIVVFKEPEHGKEDWIKRVIGLPGDVVFYNQYTQRFTVLSGCKDPMETARSVDFLNIHEQTLPESWSCVLETFTYGDFSPAPNYFYYNNYQIKRTETITNTDGKELVHYTLQNPQAINYAAAGVYRQEGLPVLTWVVPANHYFMVGDNRDNSKDSRFVGPVSYESIVGKAEFIWFSLKYNNITNALEGVNFPRIFTSLYPVIPTAD